VTVAEREAIYEEAFAHALEQMDAGSTTFDLKETWQRAIGAALRLQRERAEAAGASADSVDEADVTARVIARWQELRPKSIKPQVMRVLQIDDETERRAALLDLAHEHPGDPVVINEAFGAFYQAGKAAFAHTEEAAIAEDLAEAFIAARPHDPRGYEWYLAVDFYNVTRWPGLLHRWAEATPGEARMVEVWVALGMPDIEPEATRDVLRTFFDRHPGGPEDEAACSRVAEARVPGFEEAAGECLAGARGGVEPVDGGDAEREAEPVPQGHR
jgi:hypothetical protein